MSRQKIDGFTELQARVAGMLVHAGETGHRTSEITDALGKSARVTLYAFRDLGYVTKANRKAPWVYSGPDPRNAIAQFDMLRDMPTEKAADEPEVSAAAPRASRCSTCLDRQDLRETSALLDAIGVAPLESTAQRVGVLYGIVLGMAWAVGRSR